MTKQSWQKDQLLVLLAGSQNAYLNKIMKNKVQLAGKLNRSAQNSKWKTYQVHAKGFGKTQDMNMFSGNTRGILKVDMEMLKFIYKVIPYEAWLIYYAFYKMRTSLDIEGLGEMHKC